MSEPPPTPVSATGAAAVAAQPAPHQRRRLGASRGISGFVIRRVALGVLTLFVISLLIFAATQSLPSDPARARLGRNATPASVAALRQQLGLNRPAYRQYESWLRGVVTGNLGTSLTTGNPIWRDVSDRAKNSAFLVFVSAAVSIPLSILIGVTAALKRDRLFDNSSSFLTLCLAAMPEFVIGLLLVALLATTVFKLLPAVSIIPPGADPYFDWSKILLPAATLVLAVTPYIARIMRASMIEVLESEYIEMARLKGLSERVVVWRHALPNALGPTFQVIALNLAYLAGGVIVVESVFSYSGIGIALRDAVLNRDFTTVQALALMIAAVYVITNLIADIATILVTPRLRTRLR